MKSAERLLASAPWFRTLCDELASRAELRRDAAEADRAQLYASQILGPARAIAQDAGYELATIELVSEQISVIAVPWREHLTAPEILAEQIRVAVASLLGCAFFRGGTGDFPIAERQGRLRWPIQLGGGVSLSLSVMQAVRWAAAEPELAL